MPARAPPPTPTLTPTSKLQPFCYGVVVVVGGDGDGGGGGRLPQTPSQSAFEQQLKLTPAAVEAEAGAAEWPEQRAAIRRSRSDELYGLKFIWLWGQREYCT
ncbi:hypothetical protein AWZ03_012581 [Drosophila navojoa]|uniref:Uncharacterized protein n=1 Tax=Drosophila navojoa TaxID=7232 RepID=A0A484AWY3_DRONA|nr:hypothetical protein AWZ03_012581 [Drosophila navojoa]